MGDPVPGAVRPDRSLRDSWHGTVNAIASTLRLTAEQVATELRNGRSLSQIATEHGSTPRELRARILASMKGPLARAVSDGFLSPSAETAVLDTVAAAVTAR